MSSSEYDFIMKKRADFGLQSKVAGLTDALIRFTSADMADVPAPTACGTTTTKPVRNPRMPERARSRSRSSSRLRGSSYP
eukprot:scaffold35953_cov33-Tisochrysis_lutea.AAC.1